MGCRLWGRKELDMTEATWQQQQQEHNMKSGGQLLSDEALVGPGAFLCVLLLHRSSCGPLSLW